MNRELMARPKILFSGFTFCLLFEPLFVTTLGQGQPGDAQHRVRLLLRHIEQEAAGGFDDRAHITGLAQTGRAARSAILRAALRSKTSAPSRRRGEESTC